MQSGLPYELKDSKTVLLYSGNFQGLKRYWLEIDWLLWMRRIVSAKSFVTVRIVAFGFSLL